MLVRSLRFLLPHWKAQIVALVLTACITAVWVANPWIQKLLVDSLREGSSIGLLAILVIALVGSAILRVVLGAVQRLMFARIRERILLDLRTSLVDSLLEKEILNVKRRNSGDVISVFLQDIESMGSLYGDTFVQLVTQSFLFVAVVALMVTLDPALAALTIGSLVMFALLIKDITRPIQRASTALQDSLADASAAIGEYWNAMAEARLLCADAFIQQMVSGALDLLRRARIRFARIVSLISLAEGISWIVAGGMLWYGGQRVISGDLSLGGLLAFWNYMGLSLGPINTFLMLGGTIRSSLGAATRVFDLVDSGSKEGTARGVFEYPANVESISCRNVRFGYEKSQQVLDEFSLEIRSAEKLGLIGLSGSGKSTFAGLMARLFNATDGDIILNGRSIAEYRLSSLRASLGVVQQKPHMFTATVEENILLGRPWASPGEVEKAASKARALEFIRELPEGMETKLGEGFRQLSGGQEQRIAMARLFLKDPRMAILDEALSAVDPETADQVMDELFSSFRDRPVIVISHHPRAFRNVDRILALENGKLREVDPTEAVALINDQQSL
jgi:ABC-type bacteriocin/lantibiotic exporter with double-glycine peptidase domain